MPREKDNREPDDFKESERAHSVGRRGNEHEDIEDSRRASASKYKDASDEADEETVSEDEITEEIDLDAMAEGEGPDA